MSVANSPFAADTGCTDGDGPRSTRALDDSDERDEHDERDERDEHDDEATVRAWADDIAERVVALWVGRAEVTPIASTLIEAGKRSRGRKHRS